MKQFILPCLLASCILMACGSNKTKDANTTEETSKDKSSTESSSDKSTNPADAMTQKMEELKKLTPYTTDQLKAMVPEEFMGMKRSNMDVGSGAMAMGTSFAAATYKGDGDKQLKVTIWDCAGEGGAGLYGARYYTMWNYQHEDDNGYQKTVDFNGGKAIEQYHKGNEQYDLTYIANDRLLVVLEGEKIGLDGIKDAAKNLNLK